MSAIASTTGEIVQSTKADFSAGTLNSSLDIDTIEGSIILSEGINDLPDTREEGYSPMYDTHEGDTGMTLNKSKTFNRYTGSGISKTGDLGKVFIDEERNVLYHTFTTYPNGEGLDAYNLTNNSFIKKYNDTSTPSILSTAVNSMHIDYENDYMYVSTMAGLVVLNLNTDSIVRTYTTATTPAIFTDYVYNVQIDTDTNYLYIFQLNAVDIINLTDNTLVKRYTYATTPSTWTGIIEGVFDYSRNYLFIARRSWSGQAQEIKIIDTVNDVLVGSYPLSSDPTDIYLDQNTKYLYIATKYNGTLIKNTITGNNISHESVDYPTNILFDEISNNIYVTSDWGFYVVDGDTYTRDLSFNNATNRVATECGTFGLNGMYLDSDDRKLYIACEHENGFEVINLDNTYNESGAFHSLPQSITPASSEKVAWSATEPVGTNVTMQYRVSNSDKIWVDYFDDGDTSNVWDFDGYGNPFVDLVESNGVLSMSNSPTCNGGAYMWVDSGKTADFFPAWTGIRARVKSTLATDYNETNLFTGDSWNGWARHKTADKWMNMTVDSRSPFSAMGIETMWDAPTLVGDTYYYYVDWVSFEPGDPSIWSEWSTPCETSTGCYVDQSDLTDMDWIQYRLNLTTNDTSVTPALQSFSASSGYESSGEFISSVITTGELVLWDELTPNATLPTGTSIAYSTRTGNTATPDASWSEWSSVNSPINSSNSKYIQYKAIFTSSSPSVTPELHDVTISYTTVAPEIKITNINAVEVLTNVFAYYYQGNNNIKFKGITHPLAFVRIVVNSDPKICETTADLDGNFECTFAYIEDGLHTVTITATTVGGEVITYPQMTLGINVSLVDTGNTLFEPPIVGIALMSVGFFVVNSNKLKRKSGK
ncbi:MAG TPA: hypothetical protein PLS49_06385 [Candidatus Woesebacteria bacterium]|nr:hypothetical protein [Candidatus Woesebacteria bacterium]